MMWSNSVVDGDRIDTLISQVVSLGKDIKMLKGEVGDLKLQVKKNTETENAVVEHVAKIEDAMWKMEKKQGKVESAMQNMEKKQGEMEKKQGEIEGTMQNVEKRQIEIEKQITEGKSMIDVRMESNAIMASSKSRYGLYAYSGVTAALLSGWKYYGNGKQSSYEDFVTKSSTILSQCVEFCNHQRSVGGSEWNSMVWYFDTYSGRPKEGVCKCFKNDAGHNTDVYLPYMMHFKTI